MVTYSAPGKVFLFGEHAVVYGEPAIACAIDLRARVTVQKHSEVLITSELGKGKDRHPYVSKAIEKIGELVELDGARVTIDSKIPVGSGLGSSAAVTIATLAALNQEFGVGVSKEEIAGLGYLVEKDIQGAASPTDTYVSTMGGVVLMPDRKRLRNVDCEIVAGNTGKISSTKELVQQVRALKDKYPGVLQPIFKSIGNLARKGEMLVEKKDYSAIGELMNVNQGLLESLGVGCAELSALIYAARDAGALGAKLTGAGGGGCMVALVDKTYVKSVASAIESAGGTSIKTKITEAGVKRE